MAYYLVRAQANGDLDDLRERLDSGEIGAMRPFGSALLYALQHARSEGEGWIVWEEEDYCRPPLAMEREAVLDTYFSDLSVERVEAEQGWARIEHLPSLWQVGA